MYPDSRGPWTVDTPKSPTKQGAVIACQRHALAPRFFRTLGALPIRPAARDRNVLPKSPPLLAVWGRGPLPLHSSLDRVVSTKYLRNTYAEPRAAFLLRLNRGLDPRFITNRDSQFGVLAWTGSLRVTVQAQSAQSLAASGQSRNQLIGFHSRSAYRGEPT